MADSWESKQSRVRLLQRQQDSTLPGSIRGRVRQAAPVPKRPDIEFPPFNMHVGDTPPDDIYLGRAWMDTSEISSGSSTTTLNPSGTFSNGVSFPATLVGGGSISDSSDASYVESDEGEFAYTFGLETLPTYTPGDIITLHIRLSVTGGGDPIDAHGEVFIATSGGEANSADEIGGFSDGTLSGFGFAIPSVDGSIMDLTVPLFMSPWSPNTADDVGAALQAGAYLDFNNVENSNWDTPPVVKVYKAWIEVSTTGPQQGRLKIWTTTGWQYA